MKREILIAIKNLLYILYENNLDKFNLIWNLILSDHKKIDLEP